MIFINIRFFTANCFAYRLCILYFTFSNDDFFTHYFSFRYIDAFFRDWNVNVIAFLVSISSQAAVCAFFIYRPALYVNFLPFNRYFDGLFIFDYMLPYIHFTGLHAVFVYMQAFFMKTQALFFIMRMVAVQIIVC